MDNEQCDYYSSTNFSIKQTNLQTEIKQIQIFITNKYFYVHKYTNTKNSKNLLK